VSVTFLALLVACLARPLARHPAVLHCLWLLVLLKLVTPPLYEVRVPLPAQTPASHDSHTSAPALVLEVTNADLAQVPARVETQSFASPFWNTVEIDWSRLLATVWLAGSAASIIIAGRRIVRFRWVLNDAQPASEEVQEWVNELASNLGLERPPTVWWTNAKLSPMVWALCKSARLIIPLDLWKSLDERQQSTLVVHELAHLRRGDHRVRLFELLVTTLYWWHPVVWWARRALRDAEEQCCDAWVVWTFPDAAKSYAETLVDTLDFLNQSDQPEPLLASGFGKVRQLQRRLTMIMSGSTPRLVSIWGALGSLALGALLLPVSPTWAQKPSSDEKRETVVESLIVGDAEKIVTDAADASSALAIVLDPNNAEPNTTVNVTVKTDDQPAVAVSGSLDNAISALQDRIKAIKQKSPLSDSDKRQAEALARALEQINKIAKQIKTIDLGDAKGKAKLENKRIVIRNLDMDNVRVISQKAANAAQKAEAERRLAEAQVRHRVLDKLAIAELDPAAKEKNAQVEKALAEVERARAKVNELSKELAQRREELSRAAGELSRLKRIEARVVNVPAPKGPGGSGSATATGSAMLVRPRMSDSDRQRLADLEKKLDKILEEVASLKKARARSDQARQ
jgi:beta-lactamase regulating signal transducer with metallopeptidase domain